MARTRTIKPEFWDDEKLSRLSRDSRLVFIGIWTVSDDYGVCKGNTSYLKNKIFPYDEIPNKQFEGWIGELESIMAIIPFVYNDEKFFYIKNFHKHQKIDHPSKYRNPEPPRETLGYSKKAIATHSRNNLYETEYKQNINRIQTESKVNKTETFIASDKKFQQNSGNPVAPKNSESHKCGSLGIQLTTFDENQVTTKENESPNMQPEMLTEPLIETTPEVITSHDAFVVDKNPGIQNEREKRQKVISQFVEFWKLYPKKTKQALAEQIWCETFFDPSLQNGKADELFTKIIEAVKTQKAFWTDIQYVPAPYNWLRDKQWTDEMPGKYIETRAEQLIRLQKEMDDDKLRRSG